MASFWPVFLLWGEAGGTVSTRKKKLQYQGLSVYYASSEIATEAIVVIEDLVDAVCFEEEYSLKCEGIPQVDGSFDAEVKYTFVSDFHKEDIEYTIHELIPENIETKLVSVVRIRGFQSADKLCTLVMKMPPEKNLNLAGLANEVKKPAIGDPA